MTVQHSFNPTLCFRFVASGVLLANALTMAPVALALPASATLLEITVGEPSPRLDSPSDSLSSKPCSSTGSSAVSSPQTTDLPQFVAELPPAPPRGEAAIDPVPVPNANAEVAQQLSNGQCPIGGTAVPVPDPIDSRRLNIRVLEESPACSRPSQITLICTPF